MTATPNTVMLQDVRMEFNNLFTPGKKGGYGATFILPPTHPGLPKLQAAIVAAGKAAFGPEWETKLSQLKALGKLVIHDGARKGTRPGYAGNLYFNASNRTRPVVVDRYARLMEVEDKTVVYSGAYVNVSVEVSAYTSKHPENPGPVVSVTLLSLQSTGRGDRLGGGAVGSANDFQPLETPPESGASPSAVSAADAVGILF